jgi:hypothetical protein
LLAWREILVGHGPTDTRSTSRGPDSGGAEIVLICRRRIHIAAITLGLAWVLATRRGSGRRSAIIALHPQHAAGTGIGIEPKHPAIGREPLQAVMGLPIGAGIGPLDIGERAGAFPADAIQDLIEGADFARLHTFAGAIGLSRCRFGNRGRAEQKQT